MSLQRWFKQEHGLAIFTYQRICEVTPVASKVGAVPAPVKS